MKTSNETASTEKARPSVGVVIRYRNSVATLPAVLAALKRQTVQPDLIVGVDNQSIDASADILRAAGAKIIEWTEAYSHPRVLNFALRHCPTDLVLILSSHTVLESPDGMERLVAALADPRTACASAKWDDDPFYSDAIDWPELQTKGLKFCSIYSNSMGLLRRSLWEQVPFDDALPTMEDSGWALEQVRRGHRCRRLDVPFSYQRSGQTRDFIFAAVTFRLAARHGLQVTWLGVVATLRLLWKLRLGKSSDRVARNSPDVVSARARLFARWFWRLA